MDVGVGLGGWRDDAPWSYPTIRRLSTILAGAEPADVAAEIHGGPSDIVSFGFSLPNGDELFALWRDGVAVEEDLGVTVSLTFPHRSVELAVGIDPLSGIRQELITERTGGDLFVPDLLVRDHPVFVRLVASTH